MNTKEKIISAVVLGLILILSIWSYAEVTEQSGMEDFEDEISDFERSFGDTFIMGSFETIQYSTSSQTYEANCDVEKPVIVSVLHEIYEELNTGLFALWGDKTTFMVDPQTLALFCNTTATITLRDNTGALLTLKKVPFTRDIPEGGTAADIGTTVRINATVTPPASQGTEPVQTYASLLIPDRILIGEE